MATRYTMGSKVQLSSPWRKNSPVASVKLPAWGGTQMGVKTQAGGAPAGALATPAAAAAQASAKAPGAGGAPLPVDPAYEAQMAALARQRDTQVGGLTQQRQAGLLQYGYVQDPNTGAITFDASNVLSQAALMRRNFDNAHTGNTTSLAARGQLYSGALQNAQNETAHQQQVGEDQQIKALQAFLAKVDAAKAQAQTDYEIGAGSALGDSVARAPGNPLYSPVVDDGAGGSVQAAAAGSAAAATARTATAPAKTPKAKVRKAVAGRSQPTAVVKGKIGPAQLRGGMGPKRQTGRR